MLVRRSVTHGMAEMHTGVLDGYQHAPRVLARFLGAQSADIRASQAGALARHGRLEAGVGLDQGWGHGEVRPGLCGRHSGAAAMVRRPDARSKAMIWGMAECSSEAWDGARRARGWMVSRGMERWSLEFQTTVARHVVMSRAAEERQQEALAGLRARGAKMGAR